MWSLNGRTALITGGTRPVILTGDSARIRVSFSIAPIWW
jgi:hypothetical protein